VREDLCPAVPKIAAFLTDLAVHSNVTAATRHQAMHALVALSKRGLHHAPQGRMHAVRADTQSTVPVGMPREAVAAVLSRMDGTAHVVAKLLDGSGRRLMEAVRLRDQDSEEQMPPPTVQVGQSDKDRCPTFPPPYGMK
jgi:hypothetical protein